MLGEGFGQEDVSHIFLAEECFIQLTLSCQRVTFVSLNNSSYLDPPLEDRSPWSDLPLTKQANSSLPREKLFKNFKRKYYLPLGDGTQIGIIFQCMCVLSHFSHVQLFVTLWTIALQSPQSTRFSRQLEWAAMPSSRGSFQPRDQTQIFCVTGGFFTIEPPGKPIIFQNQPNSAFPISAGILEMLTKLRLKSCKLPGRKWDFLHFKELGRVLWQLVVVFAPEQAHQSASGGPSVKGAANDNQEQSQCPEPVHSTVRQPLAVCPKPTVVVHGKR